MKKLLLKSVCLITLALTLCSCGLKINWVPGREILFLSEDTTISSAQAKVLALACKAEYESYYYDLLGADFWKSRTRDGLSYEEYIREYCVLRECRALIFLSEEAQQMGIAPNDIDKERIDAEAQKVYEQMTDDEKAYSGASLKDITELMNLYFLANEAALQMKPDKAQVSDEESRVVDFSVIRLRTRKDAEDILKRIESGEDFAGLASEKTLDTRISYSVARGELVPALEDAVFSLKEGETSDILEYEDSFYIFRLDTYYDSLLSMNNKRNLSALRTYEGWSEPYDRWEQEDRVRINEDAWESVRLDMEGDYPDFGFYSALSAICQ